MAVAILYFASIREAVGMAEEVIELPIHVETVNALVEWLSAQSPLHKSAFADRKKLRVALNQEMANLDAPLSGAREIAFFPPVTGG